MRHHFGDIDGTQIKHNLTKSLDNKQINHQ